MIGLIWLHRYAIYPEYIHPNLQMPQHTDPFDWLFGVVVMESGFFFEFFILIILFILAKFNPLKNRMLIFPLTLFLGYLPNFYYPERAIAYVAVPLALVFGYKIVNSNADDLRKSLLYFIPLLILFILFFLFKPSLIKPLNLYSLVCILFIFAIFIIYNGLFKGRYLSFILIFLIIFTHLYSPGIILPFLSLGKFTPFPDPRPEDIESYAACKWLSENHPEAIVSAAHPPLYLFLYLFWFEINRVCSY